MVCESIGECPQREDDISDAALRNENRVANFYRGKCIFVTGATGFMGKILLEKLLRSFSDVDTIFFLARLRPQDKSLDDRVKELLSSEIFDGVRDSPLAKKLHPIAGDMESEDMGINSEQRKFLEQKVQIIFHCAATVRFQEPIKKCVRINVRGTQQILEFSRSMKQLQAFVHVSTAYANSEKLQTKEIFYPQQRSPHDVMKLCQTLDDELAEKILEPLVGNKPNSYVFSKALAETLVLEASDLPIGVVRPSIVIGAAKEPIPGWTDNMNGPNALFMGVAQGILHTFRADENGISDMVPVDIAINLMIAIAWKTAITKRPASIPPMIYHATTGLQNPVRWRDILDVGHVYLAERPVVRPFWYPSFKFRKSQFMNDLIFELTLHLPTLILELKSKLMGDKKSKFSRTYQAFSRQKEVLEYFSSREFIFHPDNTLSLLKELNEKEKEVLECDVASVNWSEFFYKYFDISRKRLLRGEDIDANPELLITARRKARRLYWLHQFVSNLPILLLAFFLICVVLPFSTDSPTTTSATIPLAALSA